MNNLIYWIHKIYYAFYCISYVARHYVCEKIPEYLILRPLFAWGPLKRMYEKRTGHTFDEMAAKLDAEEDYKTFSFTMRGAIGMFATFIICPIYIIYHFTNSALGGVMSPIFEDRPLLATIVLMAMPVIILEKILWKQDKYLEFFKSFDKDSLTKKFCYCTIILALLIVELIICMEINKVE